MQMLEDMTNLNILTYVHNKLRKCANFTQIHHENGSVRTKNIESKQQEDYKIGEENDKSAIEEQKRQRDEWRLKRMQQGK